LLAKFKGISPLWVGGIKKSEPEHLGLEKIIASGLNPFSNFLKNFGTSGFWVGEAEELKAPEGLKAALRRRFLGETFFDRSRILFISN